ncbi:ATP-binding protein [Spiractinospora alimapuensis]|uniref:ATP-binding protein n=1 Tax=Spiractinospora alimapuensis TaxID=2820884 RepID=UPI001F462C5F|nr:ATP-binding protein [Spiractinospora alimapuensis]QVQ50172.1 ATP-binding protein [Spiractinospora alimapuensis]
MAMQPNSSTAPPGETGNRWRVRVYPGNLSETASVRAHLRSDLASYDSDLVEKVAMCASEAFANAVEHSRSGEAGGGVLRAMYRTTEGRVRVVIMDDGTNDAAGPSPRSPDPWDFAESGRGLMLIDALADAWGTYVVGPTVSPSSPSVLGNATWAEFTP